MIRESNQLKAAAAVVVLAAFGGVVPAQALAAEHEVPGCVVKFQEDIKLPARGAGVLVHLGVKEGDVVRAGEGIGKVDDREAIMQKRIAEYGLNAAVKRAKDDVDIRYAKKQSLVAEADYKKLLETNLMAEKAVTETDIRRAKLDWDRSVLGIEKAQKDRKLAELDAWTKKAELDAAELTIDRMMIRAPFDGKVVTIYRHQDEWVSPGDPILRLARLDTMNVEGPVDQTEFNPSDVQDCEVTVEVILANQRSERLSGRIVAVSPVVRLDNKYQVRAEIANRQESNHWLLRDGLTATMTIHLGTGGGSVTRRP